MNKKDIVHQLTEHLRQQLATMTEAAKAAHEASTGEEAKAESKYDTRGLEASYLADAQAEQCQKLAQHLRIFESLELDHIEPGSPVELGALVEVENDGNFSYFLLTPCAGGICIDYEDADITTLSPEAPLFQNLLGCHIGHTLETPKLMVLDIF